MYVISTAEFGKRDRQGDDSLFECSVVVTKIIISK